jgi:hypothetical protein
MHGNLLQEVACQQQHRVQGTLQHHQLAGKLLQQGNYDMQATHRKQILETLCCTAAHCSWLNQTPGIAADLRNTTHHITKSSRAAGTWP